MAPWATGADHVAAIGGTGWGFTPAPPPSTDVGWGGEGSGGEGSGIRPGRQGDGGQGRRKLTIAASLVATAVVSAGAAVGVTLAVTNNAAPSATSSVTLPTAAGNQSSPRGQNLNVAGIAASVERATLDITANGPNGPDEGTGMILTRSGIVLTNNHVVDGSTQFSARIDGAGRSYAATVIGTDATRDVALLQLHGGSDFATVTLGNSSSVTVGDQVVAIGNALALGGFGNGDSRYHLGHWSLDQRQRPEHGPDGELEGPVPDFCPYQPG